MEVLILDFNNLNKKIYGDKNLNEGEYANSILDRIEQEIINFNSANSDDSFNDLDKQIKF